MSLAKYALIAVAPLLFACETTKTTRTVTTSACDLGKYQAVIGRNIGELKLPRDGAVRVISPGTAVTMDYSASRTNIYVDDKGWIAKVECG